MFDRVFGVFSRRETLSESQPARPLTIQFRHRFLMLLRDNFQSDLSHVCRELHRHVAYLHGTFSLSTEPRCQDPHEELVDFLLECEDAEFFDVIELLFNSQLPGVSWPDNNLIPAINKFFEVDDLPYFLTGYVTEEDKESGYVSFRLVAYPQIIRKESEILHQNALAPALQLLAGGDFGQANKEFLEALEHQRKGDFGDCLTKCASSFESVMKVLCHKNGVQYSQTDTASRLLKTLLPAGQLEGYWEQPLIMIATLRNRLSSSHGAGTHARVVPEHVVKYVVNSTAAAILLLHEEFA